MKRVPVAEGESVAAGQVLIELESAEWRTTLAQVDAAVSQAQLRRLHEAQAPVAAQTVRQAQVNLDNARAQLRRNTDLFKQGFLGQAALDDVRKAVALAVVVRVALRVLVEDSFALFTVATALHLFATASMSIFMATVARSMPQFAMLAGFGALMFAAALLRFRKAISLMA